MQVTFFKGLLPVNFPNSWFQNPQLIKFGRLGDKQAIDFRPVGGYALAFWVTNQDSRVYQYYEKLDDNVCETIDWGTSTDHAFAIESRRTVAQFGQSNEVMDLSYL